MESCLKALETKAQPIVNL